jgi:hypothetical protein
MKLLFGASLSVVVPIMMLVTANGPEGTHTHYTHKIMAGKSLAYSFDYNIQILSLSPSPLPHSVLPMEMCLEVPKMQYMSTG